MTAASLACSRRRHVPGTGVAALATACRATSAAMSTVLRALHAAVVGGRWRTVRAVLQRAGPVKAGFDLKETLRLALHAGVGVAGPLHDCKARDVPPRPAPLLWPHSRSRQVAHWMLGPASMPRLAVAAVAREHASLLGAAALAQAFSASGAEEAVAAVDALSHSVLSASLCGSASASASQAAARTAPAVVYSRHADATAAAAAAAAASALQPQAEAPVRLASSVVGTPRRGWKPSSGTVEVAAAGPLLAAPQDWVAAAQQHVMLAWVLMHVLRRRLQEQLLWHPFEVMEVCAAHVTCSVCAAAQAVLQRARADATGARSGAHGVVGGGRGRKRAVRVPEVRASLCCCVAALLRCCFAAANNIPTAPRGRAGRHVEEKVAVLRQAADALMPAGDRVNLDSPADVHRMLYHVLALPPPPPGAG